MTDIDKKPDDRERVVLPFENRRGVDRDRRAGDPGSAGQSDPAPMRDADRQKPEPKPNRAGFRAPGGSVTDEEKPAGESVALIENSDPDDTP